MAETTPEQEQQEPEREREEAMGGPDAPGGEQASVGEQAAGAPHAPGGGLSGDTVTGGAPAPASAGAGGPHPTARPEREFTVAARSQWRMVVRRFVSHRLAVVSLVLLLLVIVVALFGGRLWHYNYAEITDEFSSPPSAKHPFGTDGIGHDTLAQVLRGAQRSVIIALLVAFVSTSFGTLVGALAGYYRGILDAVLMRFTDLVLTVPSLAVFALLSNRYANRENGWLFLSFVIAGLLWTTIARVVRGVFLSLREREFVEAARALGAGDARIIFRHLLPNAVGPIIVNATITVAIAILLETSLSYLGLGVRLPDTSLGLLVAEGAEAAQTRPWLFYFPGVFIILIALTVNFVGDGLRDAFDPTQTQVRA
jgi:ABC-type dipeptide/oligopeptide/nickel transport system permease subunit